MLPSVDKAVKYLAEKLMLILLLDNLEREWYHSLSQLKYCSPVRKKQRSEVIVFERSFAVNDALPGF